MWGGINTLTGRDTNVSLYTGGDLRIEGRNSETEGTTVVAGDLDLQANRWGFAFGIVAMGSGQWPYADADMLVVGGDVISSPSSVAAFVAGDAVVGGSAIGRELELSGAALAGSQITYDVGAAALSAVDPGNGGAPVDYTDFSTRVTDLSSELQSGSVTGPTSIGDAVDTDVTVHSYSGPISTLRVENQALVSFTGDGTSDLQVFTLDGEALTAYAAGKTGVAFSYDGIPAGASVVVNVTGSTIEFAQGWQTFFNGVDVHDPFTTPDEFAVAATAVMFNYADADSVRITGGNATEIARTTRSGEPLTAVGPIVDSSAAQNVGSLISPAGDFVISVTTNGRLLTGGDVTLSQYGAMSIDLMLEHHSFPWNGSRTTSCLGSGSISWSKVDADTGVLLPGSAWQVVSGGVLLDVADNGRLDANKNDGEFTVTGLQTGAYLLTETLAPTGYRASSAEYQVAVTDDQMSPDRGPIPNSRIVGGATWSKIDDASLELLPGSQWRLTGPDGLDVIVDDNGVLDQDAADGVIVVGALEIGDYTLSETRAPAGYLLDATPRTFAITAAETAIDIGAIMNRRILGSVTWTKVDAATGGLLDGSAWRLTGPDGFTVDVVDDDAIDKDDATGVVLLDRLTPGDYTLTETSAPSGYALLTERIAFTISVDETDINLGEIENSRLPQMAGAGGDTADPGILAHTGGDTGLLLSAGAILVGLGLVTLAIRRRGIAS